ncbi:putative outer membrane protein [Bradyrhizobium sp. USDA 4524]|nr:putative outer membrane protein [Bradyrhizobium sp. USDA 4538]MCP1898693.1 putative outer membrane protein [Bradyrhizobium sp. USDA 4537]MCP1909192.1 putative outer membrane protein [Bradyrhizobium elkanii]MCP1987196.1 putative outer membrane protein [Bradyrhizobium sp. USDA 4539]
MRRTILAIACILLATPGLAQSVSEKTGVNSVLGVSPSTSDFVKQVAISDMFEIESSKLAQQKGNAAEKTFASQMVTDHTKTSIELKGLVALHSDFDGLRLAVRVAPAGVLDQRGPRYCEGSLAAV